MKNTLIQNIKKYVGCPVSADAEQLIENLDPESEVFKRLVDIVFVSKIHYENRCLLDYYFVSINNDIIIFKNDKNTLYFSSKMLLEDFDFVVNVLKENIDIPVQNYVKNTCWKIRKLLEQVKSEDMKKRTIKFNTVKDYAYLRINDFYYLLENLKSQIDLELDPNL